MVQALKQPLETSWHDRPGWIPTDITANWDEDPYAYQTEEESMPAGGPHNYLLTYIIEMLRLPLDARGLMLLMDIFMLYRDRHNVRRRIAPDLLLTPHRIPPFDSYNLENEPPPALIIEATSPKSLQHDIHHKAKLYSDLAVENYLVIDAVLPNGQPKAAIKLHSWQRRAGRLQPIRTFNRSECELSQLGVKIVVSGRDLHCIDMESGIVLLNSHQWSAKAEEETERANNQAQRADDEAQRANEEAQRANDEAQRANLETQRADAAEAELVRLRMQLNR